MRKILGWLLAALVLALAGGFAWGRLRPADATQAHALALLTQDHRPAQGRNAWATYWLLDYDVPDDQLDVVYARERRHLFDWAATIPVESSTVPVYASLVAQSHPKLPSMGEKDRTRLCRSVDADCLAKVREHAPSLRALLARHAVRLARLQHIAPGDVLWDDTPLTPYTPLPSFSATQDLQLTAAALDFVEGSQIPALTAVCRNVQVTRQLHARTNSLIGAMVMVSWTDAAERLFAAMLAELPSDQPIPDACEAAFAPVTVADVDLCAPMQREFQWSLAAVAPIDPERHARLRDGWRRPLVDMRGLQRLLARRYAWACQADTRESMLADRELSAAQQPAPRPDMFDYLSNAIGSHLSQIPPPDFALYLNRNTDHAAALRATRLLLQARQAGLASTALRQHLEQQLPTISLEGTRSFRFDPDGRLRMSYYAPRQRRSAQVWRIAAPP